MRPGRITRYFGWDEKQWSAALHSREACLDADAFLIFPGTNNRIRSGKSLFGALQYVCEEYRRGEFEPAMDRLRVHYLSRKTQS